MSGNSAARPGRCNAQWQILPWLLTMPAMRELRKLATAFLVWAATAAFVSCGKAPEQAPPAVQPVARVELDVDRPPVSDSEPSAQSAATNRSAPTVPVDPPATAAPSTNIAEMRMPPLSGEELALARYNEGVRLLNDASTEENSTRAAKNFHEAAEMGHAGAQHNLAVLLLNGLGVVQDPVAAREWLMKSAEQGMAEAQFKLASLYANGIGGDRDLKLSAEWARRAAAQGHGEAAYNLATLYVRGQGVETDLAEAARWFRVAAENGKAAAQSNLGVMYASGKGVTEDPSEAVKWFRKAAEQGHPGAQFNLARAYADGHGIERDDIEAYKWYILAAGQGDEDAGRAHLELGLKMRAADVAEAIRRATAVSARLERQR